jgi:hypothetical protein
MSSAIAAISLIALTIIGEARLQPLDGQRCLAWTAVNRMEHSGWDAERVLFQNHQYRVWDKDVVALDYGLRLRWLQCLTSGQFPDNPWCMEPVLMIGTPDYWWRTWSLAARIYYGVELPPEGCEGVTNYDNPIFWPDSDGLPPWAGQMELATCIGDHCFWR